MGASERERSAGTTIDARFGPYGGRYVPETLIAALDELTAAWQEAREDEAFRARLALLHRDFIGRPTPLYRAERLSERVGRRVYLKREDLAHTGAHKINNAIGQALLAQRMGKPRIIAETGAGQHGVAIATACALLGMECVVYMGTEDIRRQAPNVERMRLLGAEVAPVEAGARTLKEAVSAAIRDWVANVETTHYAIGSAVGPAPFPALVRDLQRVIGDEAREQALAAEGALPARVIACVGGGSNAIGIFAPFIADPGVELIGVEAAGEGLDTGRHGASLLAGRSGVLHGSLSSVIADSEGQILEAHSVSAGLDYPGVGPEHAQLRDTGRAIYTAVTDAAALAAFAELSRLEGIIPALESAHAIAWLLADADRREQGLEHPAAVDAGVDAGPTPAPPASTRAEQPAGFDVLCLSGRGDKDLAEVMARVGDTGSRRMTEASEGSMGRASRIPYGNAPPIHREKREATVSGAERIAAAFAAAHAEDRAALMPYMMAGFPDRESSLAIAAAYAEHGADLIELGAPFSDPLADGPTIHAAATAALRAGATMGTALEVCESVSERVPVVLMVYANMVLAQGGPAEFAARAGAAGAAGAIVPDLPLDEAAELREALTAAGLALVPLVAPTTPPERRARICAAARGFVYVVSTVGTTGEREGVPPGLADLVAATRAEAEVPVAVGFGIGTPEQVARVGEIADGVIVGSRLVRAAAEAGSAEAAAEAVGAFLAETRAG